MITAIGTVLMPMQLLMFMSCHVMQVRLDSRGVQTLNDSLRRNVVTLMKFVKYLKCVESQTNIVIFIMDCWFNGVVAYDDVYRVDTYVVLLMHQVNISVKFSAPLLNGVESSRGCTEYKMLTGNIIVPEFVG